MKKIEKKLSLNKTNLTVLDKEGLDTVKGGKGDYQVDRPTYTACRCPSDGGGCGYQTNACTGGNSCNVAVE